MSTNCITYHIDSSDRIIYLSESWQEFAVDNMAGILTSEYVLNRSIFDFFADEKVKHLYKMLIDRSRTEQVKLRLPFRCDAPDRRRYMAMEVYPLNSDVLVLRSCILREENRESIALLDESIDRSDEFLTICSWCKRVKLSDDDWREVEEAIESLRLFDDSVLPRLSHGMCSECFENARKELEQHRT